MMAKELSKNFEKEVLRRDKPTCFGKIKAKTEDKETGKTGKKICGACWFNPYCRAGKLPAKKSTNAEQKEEEKEVLK